MNAKRRWFGTDGIRGRVGGLPLTPEFVLKLGWATARVLGTEGGRLAVIGKDTRRSGYMFESALEAGFSAAGMDLRLLGPVPTPAVAYFTRTFRASVGVVISASHNSFHDNGIKFFGADGFKLPDHIEAEIEAAMDEPMVLPNSALLGNVRRIEDARGRYTEFCKASVRGGLSLSGLKLVLDCAHGATYVVAPQVFRELGAEVEVIGNAPDGVNINAGCGSMYPEHVSQAVLASGADYGIAFDGDGDRVLMVDGSGRVYDGDDLLYVIAMHRSVLGELSGPVVGTVMSNLGLEQALLRAGIRFERARVGDRYVLTRLAETAGVLGGESSGHIICLDRTQTGDGIIASLAVISAVVDSGKSLADLTVDLVKYPQVLINVPVECGERVGSVLEDDQLGATVKLIEGRLADTGRVLLRASGTEPMIRVMVEGEKADQVRACAEELVAAVKSCPVH